MLLPQWALNAEVDKVDKEGTIVWISCSSARFLEWGQAKVPRIKSKLPKPALTRKKPMWLQYGRFFLRRPVFKMLRKRDIWLWCRGLCQSTDKVDSKHVCRDTYLVVLRLQAQPDSSNFLTNTLQMNNTPVDSQALYDDFIIFHIFHHMPWNFERLGTRLNLCWYKEEDWELHRQKTGPKLKSCAFPASLLRWTTSYSLNESWSLKDKHILIAWGRQPPAPEC